MDAPFDSIKVHPEFLHFVEAVKRYERLTDDWREIFGHLFAKSIIKIVQILNSDKASYDQVDIKDRAAYRIYLALRGN
jgi:hypothetical protein